MQFTLVFHAALVPSCVHREKSVLPAPSHQAFRIQCANNAMSRRLLSSLLSSATRCSVVDGVPALACRWNATLAQNKDGQAMHPDLLNPQVKRAEYAVRGELYLRAMELQKEGMKITFTNGVPESWRFCRCEELRPVRSSGARAG